MSSYVDHEVEEVCGVTNDKGKTFFKIVWKGYTKDSAQWLPEEDLNCEELIQEFLSGTCKRRKKETPYMAHFYTVDIPPIYSKQLLLMSGHGENSFKQDEHTFDLVYQNKNVQIYMREFAPTAASATKSSDFNIIPKYVDMGAMFPEVCTLN